MFQTSAPDKKQKPLEIRKYSFVTPGWSNQTELKRDRGWEEWATVYHVEHFTLQLMWEFKWDLYFGILSVPVPVPLPH